MGNQKGRVIIPAEANVWPHEYRCAKTLADAGHTVEFLIASSGSRVKSADIQMDGVVWEIKCLETDKLATVEKKVRKALHQSRNAIIDSRRMKGLKTSDVERKLRTLADELKSLKRLILISKDGTVIDIKR